MAGLIAPSTLEQIRTANDIVDVIGSYFPLKRAGANFVALCPFHKEKTPSFNVNPHLQIFRCFGCQKGGDVFSFVREYENMTFMDAVRRLAERANIPLEYENNPEQKQAKHVKDQLLEIHELIAKRWHSALLNEASGQSARDYLKRRGVSEEAIIRFRLGSAPAAWDDTVNWAKSKGFPLEMVEKSGLVLKKENSDHFYDRFRGRLIFPICDEQGRVIGFSGRLLDEHAKAAKYVNSPETPIFHKSKVFYGLDQAKRPILDAEKAIVCEGQLDLIACHMAGIRNVVAPQGTAFTSDHARILKRYVDEAILCFDSDQAGQNAAIRSFETLLGVDVAMRVALVPEGHDPDSYIREHGADAFQRIIDGAEQFFDFFLGRLCKVHDATTDRGRLAILKDMAETVAKMGNEMVLDTYAQKTAQQLGVEPQAVRAEFRKIKRRAPFHQNRTAQREDQLQVTPTSPPPSSQEFWLLRIMLLRADLVEWVGEHLDPAWIQHRAVGEVIRLRLEWQSKHHWVGLPSFLDQFEDRAINELITQAAFEKRAIPEPEKALHGEGSRKGIVEMLRNDFVDRRLKELQRQANKPDLSQDAMAEIEAEKMRLRQLKSQPLSPLVKRDLIKTE